MSDISILIYTHGDAISINAISISADTWGYTSESSSTYTMTGIAMIMDSDSEEVKTGVLSLGDLIFFADPLDTNISYLKLNNFIQFDGNTYKITNVIKEHAVNPGDTWSHYEVHAKRII